MSIRRQAHNLLAVGSCLLALGAGTYDDSPEAWETLIDLELAGKVLEVYFEDYPASAVPTDAIPMDDFAEGLPKLYSSRLPTRDGWGRDLLVGKILGEFVILSQGADGFSEMVVGLKDLHEESGGGRLQQIEDLLGDDIFFVGGDGVFNGPRILASRQKRTMADLRTIATAVEVFSIDNDFYPIQVDGLAGLESIGHHLAPSYIRTVPMNDDWGNPFLYWSDRRTYIILSPGADGILDRAWSESLPEDVELVGECDAPNAEIVMSNGSFQQWPRLSSRR